MSDYTSYSTYIPDQEDAAQAPFNPVQNNDKTTRITYIDGVGTMEQSDRISSTNSRDLNPFPADDWRSTATDRTGAPSAMVGDSTLVTINGIQASALDFQKAGCLEKDDRGNYRLPTEKPTGDPKEAELAEARRHYAVLPQSAHATVNAALEGLTTDGVDTVTQYGVGVALGQLSPDMLARQFSTMTGHDMEASEARVPAERMKAGVEHQVPLAPAAVDMLRALARSSDYLFPGQREGRPLSDMSLSAVLRRLGRTDITVHGFRSTFRDWCAEAVGNEYPREVCEHALAHKLPDKVEAAYRRGTLIDKRALLMRDWADFCAGVK